MFENIKEININDLIEIDEEFKSGLNLIIKGFRALKANIILP